MREECSSLGCSLHAMPFLLSWVCGSLFDGLMGHLGMSLALCFGGLRSHVCYERQKRIVSLSMEEGREQTISDYPPETIHYQILIVMCFVSSQLQESCHYQN
jgi:hypothetical protein